MDIIVVSAVAVGVVLTLILLVTIAIAVVLAMYNHRQKNSFDIVQREDFPLSYGVMRDGTNEYDDATSIMNKMHEEKDRESNVEVENEFCIKNMSTGQSYTSGDEDASTELTSTFQVNVSLETKEPPVIDKTTASPEKSLKWKPPAPPKPCKPPPTTDDSHIYVNSAPVIDKTTASPEKSLKSKPPAPPKPSPTTDESHIYVNSAPVIDKTTASPEKSLKSKPPAPPKPCKPPPTTDESHIYVNSRAMHTVVQNSPKRPPKPPKPPKPSKPSAAVLH